MSKTKKYLTAIVSFVMAGAMVFSFAACGPNNPDTPDDPDDPDDPVIPELPNSQDELEVSVDADGKLSYASGTALSMNVGYNNKSPYGFITYQNDDALVTGEFDLFGSHYAAGNLKPAWATLQEELDVTFKDNFTNLSSDNQIKQAITDGVLSTYDVITGSTSAITTQANADPDMFLDLSMYLDYMPNYKAFLEENPIIMLSLTSSTDTGAMYMAPYFDGNDDIEKYEIANMTWIEKLLDGTEAGDSTTFTAQATAKQAGTGTSASKRGDVLDGTSASATSYMGQTGSWWVETTDVSAADLDENGEPKDGVDTSKTTTVVVNYDDALAAAKDSSTPLGAAVAAAGADAASLTSGNIVDLQNAAIDETDGEVTGAQLLAILRAYIDVAYQTEDGAEFYDVRSDVFNGYNAAWDVDLLVALSRCVVTNTSLLDTQTAMADIYAISGRQGTTQRFNDLLSLTGELYGERGLTFRYEYAYIDSDNSIKDARIQEDTYTALDRMNALVEEGLIYTGTETGNGTISYYTANQIEALMIWDYVQTQTAKGGYTAMGIGSEAPAEVIGDDYNFAPIVTPVSKWNDGTTDDSDYDYIDGRKVMRFTESWRSVKNSGFAVPYEAVANNPENLAAVLAFIDYMFSNDGQILMTYGPQSSTNDLSGTAEAGFTSEDNGFWYNEEATGVKLEDVAYQVEGSDQYTVKDEYAAQYFIYKNKVYTGTYYKGEMQPTMTDANLQLYYGSTVNDIKLGSAPIGSNYALNYTSYARGIIGSALPIGNKLQSFEYQCTADCGIIGADKVAACLTNGTIEHVYQQITENPWYTIIPSALPYDTVTSSAIAETWTVNNTTWFASSSSTYINWLLEIMFRGLDGETSTSTYLGTAGGTLPDSAAAAVSVIEGLEYDTYQEYMTEAWGFLIEYYDANYAA